MSDSHRPALLEVAPGPGWLAREGEMVVWVPEPVDVDVAHRCIEPLLLTGGFDAAMHLVRSWPEPSIRFLLARLNRPRRVITLGHELLRRGARVEVVAAPISERPSARVHDVPDIGRMLSAGTSQKSSGMLVEGVVRAGGWRLHLDGRPSGHQPRPIERPWILESRFGPEEITGSLVLGRAPERGAGPSVLIPDPAVSRRHARVVSDRPYLRIVDECSRNGTWVLDRRGGLQSVHHRVPYPLSDGDTVVIGRTWFVVRRGRVDDANAITNGGS